MRKQWWGDGVRFKCQGSGKCCVSRGTYGHVYVSLTDRKRFAKHLKMKTQQFTRDYCEKTAGYYHLKDDPGSKDCIFLKDKRCTVYEGRPTQCRTWPFWPENMKARKWDDIASFCPGVGKGSVVPAEEIQKQIDLMLASDSES